MLNLIFYLNKSMDLVTDYQLCLTKFKYLLTCELCKNHSLNKKDVIKEILPEYKKESKIKVKKKLTISSKKKIVKKPKIMIKNKIIIPVKTKAMPE